MSENDQATTAKQDSLIELLLAGVNITTAAKNLQIAEKTARRWLKLEHVQQAYKKAQQSVFDDRLNALRTGVTTALVTLQRNMTDKENVPPSTQVAAARIWLEQAIQIHKMSELETRIAELEGYLESQHRR